MHGHVVSGTRTGATTSLGGHSFVHPLLVFEISYQYISWKRSAPNGFFFTYMDTGQLELNKVQEFFDFHLMSAGPLLPIVWLHVTYNLFI